ncbi:transglutaminase family protein [Actinotalea sp. M2MS4P-6]|uniref:transglutaminase-like domain-containing protein n=1 Tax=Actinotalea sp. M2MS4P-6 TaxID=2983762 RepID=UPI0021E4EC7E|nr:transglutaminase family protein [Actinotalea sp. M2MS4P-6]MCV2393177.1 transglutaminase family protein [Actinotalea sp. M2MS4P-6]
MRHVSAHLTADVTEPAGIALAVSVAHGAWSIDERLDVTLDGAPLDLAELTDGHGTRLHRFDAGVGHLEIAYRATVTGRDLPSPTDPLDLVTYLRPSRYAESDALLGLAGRELGHLSGTELIRGAGTWVAEHLDYVVGSTRGTDGAREVLLSGAGVCRDFAHATVAVLRALDVPARLVAVYAPGLEPMDFHAVAEAWTGEEWEVVDATRLAPRASMVRIATGRDAADTAFLTTIGGAVTFGEQTVTAVVDGDLPIDDPKTGVVLG